MPGFGALGQYPLGGAPTGSVSIVVIGWFGPFSEPIRFKRDPRANLALENQFFAFDPEPFVSFGWYGSLTDPVRKKPFNPAADYPYQFFQPAPSPFVADGWFDWLSEPVRHKRGLRAPWHPFETQAPQFIPSPAALLEGWFNWLSEPKRFKQGLQATLQQSFTWPQRVLPTPTVTVVLDTTEINSDVAAIDVVVIKFNAPATCSVSIAELPMSGTSASIQEQITGITATSVVESSG